MTHTGLLYYCVTPGNCSEDGEDNDNDQLYCGPNSLRCVHNSVVCDSLGADNCGNGGDQSDGYPAYCNRGTYKI